jgi:hypothetical protein
MTNSVIPAEAVEAATDAMQQFALVEDRDGLQSWEAYAKLALEAAAPHMPTDDSCCCGTCGL